MMPHERPDWATLGEPGKSITVGRLAGLPTYLLEAVQFLPAPVEPIFEFFSDAYELEAITPPWLQFVVMHDGPLRITLGAQINYRLRLHGIPLRWQSRISEWDPPRRFVDEQLRGPYRQWRHEHTFEPVDGGTLCRDRVHYRVTGGWLVERLLVRRSLLRIFDYRQRRLEALFQAGTRGAAE
jgi:ligand-binding SRPBCC domain-containing protein